MQIDLARPAAKSCGKNASESHSESLAPTDAYCRTSLRVHPHRRRIDIRPELNKNEKNGNLSTQFGTNSDSNSSLVWMGLKACFILIEITRSVKEETLQTFSSAAFSQ